MHENLDCLNTIIEQQIKLVEDTPAGEDRDRAIESLCKLLSKSNEGWRQYSDEINNEARIQNDRFKTETEAELRRKQNRNDKLRSILDISKHVLSVAAFVTFEIIACKNERDDIMPRNQMHVKNNQIKLKI